MRKFVKLATGQDLELNPSTDLKVLLKQLNSAEWLYVPFKLIEDTYIIIDRKHVISVQEFPDEVVEKRLAELKEAQARKEKLDAETAKPKVQDAEIIEEKPVDEPEDKHPVPNLPKKKK